MQEKVGENMVVYNSQLVNDDETRRNKLAPSHMISFILALVGLRRNFDLNISCTYLKRQRGE